MSYSYSGDPSLSVRDEVRFLVQDTDVNIVQPDGTFCGLITDLELDYIIDKWIRLYGSALMCASIAAAQISRKWTSVITVSDGGTTANVGDLQARYTLMAAQLRDEYELEGDIGGLADLDNILIGTTWDSTITPLSTSIGLDDNPRAGRQNWGNMPSSGDLYDMANEGILW